jgi:hypothetical protein
MGRRPSSSIGWPQPIWSFGSDMIGILNFLDVAKMLGAHSTLQKPFEMKTLLDTVHAELQEWQDTEKVVLLTRLTTAATSPARPEAAKTVSGPRDASFPMRRSRFALKNRQT